MFFFWGVFFYACIHIFGIQGNPSYHNYHSHCALPCLIFPSSFFFFPLIRQWWPWHFSPVPVLRKAKCSCPDGRIHCISFAGKQQHMPNLTRLFEDKDKQQHLSSFKCFPPLTHTKTDHCKDRNSCVPYAVVPACGRCDESYHAGNQWKMKTSTLCQWDMYTIAATNTFVQRLRTDSKPVPTKFLTTMCQQDMYTIAAINKSALRLWADNKPMPTEFLL